MCGLRKCLAPLDGADCSARRSERAIENTALMWPEPRRSAVDVREILGQFDYAPTRFGGETQHNFQVGFGAGVRW